MFLECVHRGVRWNRLVLMAIQEPPYKVDYSTPYYEVRKYEPTIVAETIIDASFDDSGNQAFRILADYIFGNNKSKSKIAMTAPVSQQAASEKIAMTAPVNQIKTSSGYVVQFTMPHEFTLETLPLPVDSRVHLRQLPARNVAVYSYSGSWSESRYKEKLQQFSAALKTDNKKTVGEPVFARYNSPFALWFLRRNEIWLELAP